MNHTPVQKIDLTAGAGATTVTQKHRAVIISNTGAGTSSVTLTFTTTDGISSGDFIIRLVVNSGPFYIPCRIASASAATSNASILLLA
jgi:hypothetical protein